MRTGIKIKKSIAVLVFIVFAVVFVYRYHYLNTLLPNPEVVIKGIGESVEYEGYTFTLKKMQMIDGKEANKIAPEMTFALNADGSRYEDERVRVIMAYVEIRKNTDEDTVLDFTSIVAESKAWTNGLSQMFVALNPNVSIQKFSMAKGETKEVLLPFSMVDTMFKKKSWEKIDEREFSVVLSYYPKKIVLMEE